MAGFNEVVYDAARNIATVGAGLKWGDVYGQLDKFNVTVVGGRVLDVGVGGLILGSGLWYLSDLYGLACDNVVNFEVVLANGSAVNANVTSNADLFWALKGGSNNFAIVIAFTLSTYPIHNVWGGVKQYSLDQLPALMAAMTEYQSVPNKDPYANLMLQAFTTNASVGAVLNMVYLKPEASPPAFEPFYSISTTADTTKLQTLTEMLSWQMVPPIPRWDWFATSFTPNASLYQEIATIVTSAPELATLKALTSGTMALGLQPISSSLVLAGNDRGDGNALDLQSVNQTWFVLDTGWQFASDDATAYNATRAIKDRIERASRAAGDYVPYIFMNDASWDQDVLGHYGAENVRRLREVQRVYDPDLVFQELVSGGFKLNR
ncbi:FAD-binding oxidoreductase [Rasamsonia emersonii CBS 393.64]|uniref:FAD-binding oxidoreductase n=1 Tax=Rasamsonia emersonii (strain ATCC 16479 / CBS 393.64 / IMI 116815) TaxID=1408163 RepID=A0A0F4YJ31_RASE3|nr:FAD-binding oxidoreductase [Rasamsonia emersonii CBS 393.64]KKA18214.1 FAD-binding oxidoreductase [Rasamsonia emersonii CBS 393.64]